MKKAMLILMMAVTLAGCGRASEAGLVDKCAVLHTDQKHFFGKWSDAVWNDEEKKMVQERACDCCNVVEVRTVVIDRKADQ